ncbi:MAG TPA: T9SS type A sorting domain-containing protein [Bacteroidota bacterium]|nr:T9SS type A sorting domain-containing protein [Bacteroidota bacterium]
MGTPRIFSRPGLIAVVAAVLVSHSFSFASTHKPRGTSISGADTTESYSIYLINDFLDIVGNNGDGSFNPRTNSAGGEIPNGSALYSIFEDGLVWGGYQNGQLKVGGSTYRHGLQPGKIVTPGTGGSAPISDDPTLSKYRVYRVRPDINPSVSFDSAKARLDAELANYPPLFFATSQQLYDQYITDWNEWPASDGAPFFDKNGDGIYEPSVDIPGVPGADQTLWYVANDLDPAHTTFLYGSQPLGLEFQRTVWGYNSVGPLGQAMFSFYRVVNKSGARIDSMYLTQWSDPDIGDASDDFVGCDSTMSLGYAYNAQDIDAQYGPYPPAIAYVLLGPAVPGSASDSALVGPFKIRKGYKNLMMTSFNFFINGGTTYFDPQLGDYSGTVQWYNLMKGLVGSTGAPHINPTTGRATKFPLSGNPLIGTGWIDGSVAPPGDRRMALSAGPITMAAGDTAIVASLLIGEWQGTRLQNVAALQGLISSAKSFLFGGIELAITHPSSLYPLGSVVPIQGTARILGLTLQPSWFLASRPAMSSARLVQTAPFDVQVVTDVIGHYVVGFTASAVPETLYAAFDISSDRAPVANFMAPNEVTLGDTIKLDGSVSYDPDKDSLKYQWKVTGDAPGEYAYLAADTLRGILMGGTTAKPVYVADRMSLLTIQETVSDALFSTTLTKTVRVNPSRTANISFGKIFPLSYYFQTGIFGSVEIREFNSEIWANGVGSLALLDFGASTTPSIWYPVGIGRFAVPNDRLLIVADANVGTQVITTNGAGTETSVVTLDPDHSLNQKPDTTAWDVYFQNPYLLFSYGLPGLYVYGLSIPGIPATIAQYSNGRQWRNFAVSGNTLYALHTPTQEMSIVDISDPTSIQGVGVVKLNNAFTLIKIDGQRLYLAEADTVAVYSIGVPAAPSLLGQLTVPRKYRPYNVLTDISVSNNVLLMTTVEGCYIYDMTNPAAPAELAHMVTGIPMSRAFYDGSRMMVSLYDALGTGSADRPGGAGEIVYTGPTGVATTVSLIPASMTLEQCYPNPFNPSTTISFSIPRESDVSLVVYDILGREVKTLLHGREKPGVYRLSFDGSRLSTGVYFYRLKAGTETRVKKMLLLK